MPPLIEKISYIDKIQKWSWYPLFGIGQDLKSTDVFLIENCRIHKKKQHDYGTLNLRVKVSKNEG